MSIDVEYVTARDRAGDRPGAVFEGEARRPACYLEDEEEDSLTQSENRTAGGWLDTGYTT